METDLIQFGICPNCGSTEYMEDYPVTGKRICTQCGHENVKIKLKVVGIEQEISNLCPSCGKEREENETIVEEDDIIVFRCNKCEELDGYMLFDFSAYEPEFDDRAYNSLSVKIAEQEGRKGKRITLPMKASRLKEFKKSLGKKEKGSIEKCKKQLRRLLNEKTQEMNASGISTETINSARRKVVDYLKGKPVTHRQLTSLLVAAIYEASHEDLIGVGGFKRIGEKVSERQLEKIFEVKRKTMRKWRKRLPRRINKFYL